MTILTGLFIVCLYFLPTINAAHRKHRNKSAILLSNLFFGFTGIGWIVCLIWSSTDNVSVQGN